MKIVVSEDVGNFVKKILANASTKRILFWMPRALCILFAAFLSMFALDVFGEAYGFGETAIALLMHLIPAIFVIVMLIIAWRRDWAGAILFTVLALVYGIWSRRFDWIVVVSGPLLFLSFLFLLNGIYLNSNFKHAFSKQNSK